MKKPDKLAPVHQRIAYRLWVRSQLKDWDPADDRGGPDVYVPRFNGIKASEVENVADRDDRANEG